MNIKIRSWIEQHTTAAAVKTYESLLITLNRYSFFLRIATEPEVSSERAVTSQREL